MMRMTLSVLVSGLLLGGCSILNTSGRAEFACPGMPSGVVCKSPLEVYALSEPTNTPIRAGESKETTLSAQAPLPAPGQTKGGHALVTRADYPMPLREPAQVMRIWIAPWVDDKDDLHYPGYVFTEITPRKWAVGAGSLANLPSAIPHRAGGPVQPRVETTSTTPTARAPHPNIGITIEAGNEETSPN